MQTALFKTKISEAQVLRDVMQYLKLNNIFHWRNNSGAYSDQVSNRFIRFGFKGSSDILAIYPGVLKTRENRGKLYAIECKRPGGLLSEAQISFLRDVMRHGGIITIAESINDVERQLSHKEQLIQARYQKALDVEHLYKQ